MNYAHHHRDPLKNLLMKLSLRLVNESAHFWPEKRPKQRAEGQSNCQRAHKQRTVEAHCSDFLNARPTGAVERLFVTAAANEPRERTAIPVVVKADQLVCLSPTAWVN